MKNQYLLGIDIGSTTVKIAILDNTYAKEQSSPGGQSQIQAVAFSGYERHFANIQGNPGALRREAY